MDDPFLQLLHHGQGVRWKWGDLGCDLGFKLLPAARVTLVVSLLYQCLSTIVDNTSSFRANHDEVFTV